MINTPSQIVPQVLRTNLMNWVNESENYQYFITLNHNCNIRPELAMRKMSHFVRICNCRLFKRKKEQLRGFAVLEHDQKGNPHHHLVLNLPENRRKWFESIAKRFWLKHAPYGSIDIKIIHNQHGAIQYMFKSLNGFDNWDNWQVF